MSRGGRLVHALLAVSLLAPAGCSSSLPGATASPSPAASSSPPASTGQGAVAIQQAMVAVVRAVEPSVVLIDTGRALGSGVVFDNKGDVVTNNHVVEGASSFTVTLADGKRYPANLVGTFPPDDLAVVHIQGATPKPASFGDSSKLQVGDIVLAIGNPLGLQSSVTEGIVSAVGRTVTEPGGAVIPDAVQTSAAINPGNSGGALVNLESRVIGIPTLAAVDRQIGGAAPGIGFAIASNTARDVASQLVSTGKVTNSDRAYLGIGAANTTVGAVLVARVEAGGPADRAGIKAGDLIAGVENHATPTVDALARVLAQLHPGQQVPVNLIRPDGSKSTVTVTLGTLTGS